MRSWVDAVLLGCDPAAVSHDPLVTMCVVLSLSTYELRLVNRTANSVVFAVVPSDFLRVSYTLSTLRHSLGGGDTRHSLRFQTCLLYCCRSLPYGTGIPEACFLHLSLKEEKQHTVCLFFYVVHLESHDPQKHPMRPKLYSPNLLPLHQCPKCLWPSQCHLTQAGREERGGSHNSTVMGSLADFTKA